LKTLGGIPEVEAATQTTSATAIATKTEQVAQSQPKPVWKSTPSGTVPSSKTPLEPIGVAEKSLANPKTVKELERVRGIKRQNKAAEVLAKNGYRVEYQPKVETFTERMRYPWLDPKKKPDFKIEGEIFDAYSPNKNTDITNVLKAVEKKTIDGQARRILLNLDDSNLTPAEIIRELRVNKIEFLDEIITVKNGKITKIYPF
jgi:hypothetical protein